MVKQLKIVESKFLVNTVKLLEQMKRVGCIRMNFNSLKSKDIFICAPSAGVRDGEKQ